MITFQKESDRHRLIYDRPHLYKYTCGMEVSMFVTSTELKESVVENPKEPVKYLECGHAACALEGGECVMCR